MGRRHLNDRSNLHLGIGRDGFLECDRPRRPAQIALASQRPTPDKPGGLTGSMQHLPETTLFASKRLNLFAGTNSSKSKALYRF
jgi:hypothetical protein